MTITIGALKTELLSSPYASFYSAAILAGDYNALVDTINRISATNTITVGMLRAIDLQQLVIVGEYSNLTQVHRDLWNAIIATAAQNGLPVSNTLIRNQIAGIWSAGTTTRANLVSAQTRTGTRGEVLFGEGARVDINSLYVALTQ